MNPIRPAQVREGAGSPGTVLVGKPIQLPRGFQRVAAFLRHPQGWDGTSRHAILAVLIPAGNIVADLRHPNDARTLAERLQTTGRIRYL